MRSKYAEFEDKIKELEQKTTGSVSKDFDVNIVELYKRYMDQGLEAEQGLEDNLMFSFIRDEWLSMIIARKQYVKDSKSQLKSAKKLQQPRSKMEEEKKVPAMHKRTNSVIAQSQLRTEIEQAKQS